MKYSELFSYNIGLLAPSGIGKTSLLTSIIMQMQSFQQSMGLRCRISPSTRDTEEKIDATRRQFDRAIALEEFSPIPGSSESMKFEVCYELDLEDSQERIDIDFMDYRGGDLLKDFAEIEKSDWYRKMMTSKDLFLPIDAVIVMEYSRTKDDRLLDGLFLERMREMILRWLDRCDDSAPYTLAFVPIKIETYVVRGQMDELRQAIRELYYFPLQESLLQKDNLVVQYNPVETYGCVVLDKTVWTPPLLQQYFKIIRNAPGEKITPRIRGAADLMLAIFRKRFHANLQALEKRASELHLKLDVKNPFLRKLIQYLPFLQRGVKDELSRLDARKEYYKMLVDRMVNGFDSAYTEFWQQIGIQ